MVEGGSDGGGGRGEEGEREGEGGGGGGDRVEMLEALASVSQRSLPCLPSRSPAPPLPRLPQSPPLWLLPFLLLVRRILRIWKMDLRRRVRVRPCGSRLAAHRERAGLPAFPIDGIPPPPDPTGGRPCHRRRSDASVSAPEPGKGLDFYMAVLEVGRGSDKGATASFGSVPIEDSRGGSVLDARARQGRGEEERVVEVALSQPGGVVTTAEEGGAGAPRSAALVTGTEQK